MAEATSATATATAPSLVGVWVHDPLDPDATLHRFPFAEGREEQVEPAEATLDIVGRVNALVEYGLATRRGISLTVFIPFGDTHDADKQWWVHAVENRRSIVYRDNRGRVQHSAILGGLAIADGRAGTALGISLQRVDHDVDVGVA